MSISFHCFDFDTITEVAPAAAVAVTTSRHYCMGASLHGKSRWAGSDLSAILGGGIGGWDPGCPGCPWVPGRRDCKLGVLGGRGIGGWQSSGMKDRMLGVLREEGLQARSPGRRDCKLGVFRD